MHYEGCVKQEAVAAHDESTAAEEALAAQGLNARSLADELAELKAVKVSHRLTGGLGIGADQVLTTEDETLFDKPASREDAARQLLVLRGKTHMLISAAFIALNGQPIWRAVDDARLTVRSFSDVFLDPYLWPERQAVAGCVGCFRLGGVGWRAVLKIEGAQ